MPVQTPFRITPSLGPDLWQSETQYHWDTIGDPTGAGIPSYQPGSKVIGNDGHEYVFVRASAGIAAGGDVAITEGTWVTTAGATHESPRAVTTGEWFHARKIAL